MNIKTLLTDEEIEAWLKNRLGESNRFEQFNRKFCRDFADFVNAKTKRVIVEWLEEKGDEIVEYDDDLEESRDDWCIDMMNYQEFKKWAGISED